MPEGHILWAAVTPSAKIRFSKQTLEPEGAMLESSGNQVPGSASGFVDDLEQVALCFWGSDSYSVRQSSAVEKCL